MADLEMNRGTSLQQPCTVVSKTWSSKGIMRKVEGRGLSPPSPDGMVTAQGIYGMLVSQNKLDGLGPVPYRRETNPESEETFFRSRSQSKQRPEARSHRQGSWHPPQSIWVLEAMQGCPPWWKVQKTAGIPSWDPGRLHFACWWIS